MKKLFKRILILVLVLGMFGVMKVDATYMSRRTHLGAGLYLVGSIYADETSSGYINGEEPAIYAEGASGLSLVGSNTRLVKFSNGYRLNYRGYLEGQVSLSLKGKFEQAGFSIEGATATTIKVSKYVEGSFYFTKARQNKCDRWGNCMWGETSDTLEMR